MTRHSVFVTDDKVARLPSCSVVDGSPDAKIVATPMRNDRDRRFDLPVGRNDAWRFRHAGILGRVGIGSGFTAAALMLAGAMTIVLSGSWITAIVLLASGSALGLIGSALTWVAPRQQPSSWQGGVLTPRVAGKAAAEWVALNDPSVVRLID